MKRFVALFAALLIGYICYGAIGLNADTIIKKHKNSAVAMRAAPQYPGGANAFNRYVARNLHYPDAAKLMCINGKVYVSFSIDTSGKVTDVTAINCLGAGCESEAVRVVQKSRRWKPAIRNGKPIQVSYVIPISFYMETRKVYMENLMASGYGFVFKINGKLYSADDAERIIGKAFNPDKIEVAEPFNSQTPDRKLLRSHKKETYLISIKSS